MTAVIKAIADSRCDPRGLDDCLCERQKRTLRAWLLAVLRFALTLDDADRLAVLACATELDKRGPQQREKADFRFFHWTSRELCAAIVDRSLPSSPGVMRQHLARIDDDRLKRTFATAIDIDIPIDKPKSDARPAKRVNDLWKGLGR